MKIPVALKVASNNQNRPYLRRRLSI
ncbi:Bgt-4328 [Blumeria graminis f. sp. tritici]|uniref:Bgt-4328 n=1 Tax=Blumeria graminis f. sp. tritici TaxID=62690 RepID=A0A9X9MF62_BLUGR|nr:Bgt-4328 [Blumeria graminis f. sp. tritici]